MQNDEDLPIVSEKAWQLVTEGKILAAAEDGQFADLPGMGRPITSIDALVEQELAEWRAKRDSAAGGESQNEGNEQG